MRSAGTPSRGATPVDYDGDGDVDLLVNNYVLRPNLLFDNQGDGTVSRIDVKTRKLVTNIEVGVPGGGAPSDRGREQSVPGLVARRRLRRLPVGP